MGTSSAGAPVSNSPIPLQYQEKIYSTSWVDDDPFKDHQTHSDSEITDFDYIYEPSPEEEEWERSLEELYARVTLGIETLGHTDLANAQPSSENNVRERSSKSGMSTRSNKEPMALPLHLKRPQKTLHRPLPRDVEQDCLATPIPSWRKSIPKQPSPLRKTHMPPLNMGNSVSFARPTPIQRPISPFIFQRGGGFTLAAAHVNHSTETLGLITEDEDVRGAIRGRLAFLEAKAQERHQKKRVRPRQSV